jgi:hypothetical protein
MGIYVHGRGWAPAHVVATTVAARSDFDPTEAAAALGGEGSHREGVDWYLHNRRVGRAAIETVRFSLDWLDGALNVGGHPDRLSLAANGVYELHGGGNAVIDGGYRRLIDHLGGGLDIRLDDPAVAIEHGPEGAVLSTAHTSYRADRVVVTVPLGVLQAGSIVFAPELGPNRRSAIERLGMGGLEKVVLRFERRFWPEWMGRVSYVSERRHFPAWTDMTDHAGAPVLVAFYNPVATPGLADMSPPDRISLAVEVLSEFTGLPVPQPVAAFATDWSGDPYSRGSYSHFPLGSRPEDMATLATPASDALHFAGEHTVPEYFGTVHGAYVSGVRAAQSVMAIR